MTSHETEARGGDEGLPELPPLAELIEFVYFVYSHTKMSFWKLTTDRAILPTKGTDGSAGWDLYAEEDITIRHEDGNVLVKLSIAVEYGAISRDAYMRIAPRSGNALRHINVGAGVVDSDYVNAIGVVLQCVKPGHSVTFKRGERIAQAVFERLHDPEAALREYRRNGGAAAAQAHDGFGSTGQ